MDFRHEKSQFPSFFRKLSRNEADYPKDRNEPQTFRPVPFFSFIPPSAFLALRLAGRAPTIPFAPLARSDFGLSDSESIFLSTILNFALTYFSKDTRKSNR